MFQITRVYSDSNGDSHFEDIEIPLKEAGHLENFQMFFLQRELYFVKSNHLMIGTFM